ncbi:MAG: hypothetical protein AB7E85_08225 [Pseudobdellovibrionaceae bacterium]
MGQDTIIVTAARITERISGDEEVRQIANIAAEVGWRVFNPPAAISDAISGGISRLIRKDGMGDGTAIGNDIDLYQAGMDGQDLTLAGISVSPVDIGMGIAKRFVPASFVLGDTRRVLDARDDVNDHKEMIRGMAERGVPGFAHEIMIKDGGEAVEVFAQVPLDGGKPVTYVDSYDGQIPSGARTMHSSSNMREALTYEAADSLEHWAMRTEAAAHDNLRAEAAISGEDPDMNGAEADATARTAVSIAYQQLKGNAVRQMAEGVPPAPHTGAQVRLAGNSATPENLLPAGFDNGSSSTAAPQQPVSGPTPGFIAAFKDLSI